MGLWLPPEKPAASASKDALPELPQRKAKAKGAPSGKKLAKAPPAGKAPPASVFTATPAAGPKQPATTQKRVIGDVDAAAPPPQAARVATTSSAQSSPSGSSSRPAPTASQAPPPPKSGIPQAPVIRSVVGVAVKAQGATDRRGGALPEVRWMLNGQSLLYEIVLRWAKDVLRLPEKNLPSGLTALEKKGVSVHGTSGPIPMESELSTVLGQLGARDGHRLLLIAWPAKSLPSGWLLASSAARRAEQDKKDQKPKKGKICAQCEGEIEFRKRSTDDGFRTFAICETCNILKGGLRGR